jgi:hypothetical protein
MSVLNGPSYTRTPCFHWLGDPLLYHLIPSPLLHSQFSPLHPQLSTVHTSCSAPTRTLSLAMPPLWHIHPIMLPFTCASLDMHSQHFALSFSSLLMVFILPQIFIHCNYTIHPCTMLYVTSQTASSGFFWSLQQAALLLSLTIWLLQPLKHRCSVSIWYWHPLTTLYLPCSIFLCIIHYVLLPPSACVPHSSTSSVSRSYKYNSHSTLLGTCWGCTRTCIFALLIIIESCPAVIAVVRCTGVNSSLSFNISWLKQRLCLARFQILYATTHEPWFLESLKFQLSHGKEISGSSGFTISVNQEPVCP